MVRVVFLAREELHIGVGVLNGRESEVAVGVVINGLHSEARIVLRADLEGELVRRKRLTNERLIARDGELAGGFVLVGDAHRLGSSAFHALALLARKAREHEVVAILNAFAGDGRIRLNIAAGLEVGGAVDVRRAGLDDDIVRVGVEVAFLARGENRAAILAGGDRIYEFIRADRAGHCVVRAIDRERSIRNIQAVRALLGDGEIALADEADIVGEVVSTRGDVELGGFAGEGKVAVGVRTIFDRGLAGRGDAIAVRHRHAQLIGRAGATHQAGVIDIAAIREVARGAILRRGGREIRKAIDAVCIRVIGSDAHRHAFHIGNEPESGVSARHLGFGRILDAVGVFIDPHPIAQSNAGRRDGDLGIRAGKRGAGAIVIHAVGAVDGKLVIILRSRICGHHSGIGEGYGFPGP